MIVAFSFLIITILCVYVIHVFLFCIWVLVFMVCMYSLRCILFSRLYMMYMYTDAYEIDILIHDVYERDIVLIPQTIKCHAFIPHPHVTWLIYTRHASFTRYITHSYEHRISRPVASSAPEICGIANKVGSMIRRIPMKQGAKRSNNHGHRKHQFFFLTDLLWLTLLLLLYKK